MQFDRRMADDDFDCDTELCLTPGGRQRINTGLMRRAEKSPAGDIAGGEQRQEMTMLYGGRVCAGDVTELQARAIIRMARREMTGSSSVRSSSLVGSAWPDAPPPPPAIWEPLPSNSRLSMKRSLQRFLQQRNASIPYPHHKKDNLYQQLDSSSLS